MSRIVAALSRPGARRRLGVVREGTAVATIADCERAFAVLAERLSDLDDTTRRRRVLDRTVSCSLRDLGIVFAGHLRDGELTDVRQVERSEGQLRLSVTSDDLLLLIDGSLPFAKAWTSGRLRIDANVFDLLKLRTFI